ncbi:MAG: hypothetical protein LBC40_09570, partial [Dysgonamonadaceae bacterium]|nr:hypothetical protein [Dysgonamonadaceae bacterium]
IRAAKKDDAADLRYDIECTESGTDGNYLIKVWVYAKKAKVSSDQIKSRAVHGVLFKGYAGAPGKCTAQKALLSTSQSDHAEFFNAFFAANGDYLKYVTLVSATPETIKIGKKDFKIGMVVSVAKDKLRQDLEKAGIKEGLSSRF